MGTKGFLRRLILGLVMISVLVFVAGGHAIEAKVFKWKYFAMINLKVYAYGPLFYAMCEEIKEKTGGQLPVSYTHLTLPTKA